MACHIYCLSDGVILFNPCVSCIGLGSTSELLQNTTTTIRQSSTAKTPKQSTVPSHTEIIETTPTKAKEQSETEEGLLELTTAVETVTKQISENVN